MHAIYILDCEGISCVMLVHSVLCTVTRLVYSLVLECFPLRVCASPFQEEKKNLKRRHFGEDASFKWREKDLMTKIVLAKITEMEIQLCLLFLHRSRKTYYLFFSFLEVRNGAFRKC